MLQCQKEMNLEFPSPTCQKAGVDDMSSNMSQAKVDKYKQDKANRQKIMRKEKRERLVWKVGGYLVCALVVCWIGFSAYNKFHVPVAKGYEVSTGAIDDYLDGLDEE